MKGFDVSTSVVEFCMGASAGVVVGVVSGDIDDADAYGVLGWLSSMKMGAGQEMVRSWNWIGSKKTVDVVFRKCETSMIDSKREKRDCLAVQVK